MNQMLDERPMARRAVPGKEAKVGARLPYARHLDDRTIETRDGLLLQFLHLTGLPFETADSEEINYRKVLREGALRAMASSRFAVYHHIVRREVSPELVGEFGDPFSRALDEAWRTRLAAKKLYVNDLYITIVRRPLQGKVGALEKLFQTFGGARSAQSQNARTADLRELSAARETLLATLAPYGARTLKVYDTRKGPCSQPLEFLSSLFNGEMRPVLLPRADLGYHLPYRRVSFGAETVELSRSGDMHRAFGAMLSIKDYPSQTAAGMLDDLLRLPYEMTVSQSFGFIDRQASLDRMNLALRRMRSADDEARSLRQGMVDAKDDVATGRAAFGEHHLTVSVWEKTPAALNEAVAEVQSSFTDMGIIAVREDVNLEPAFWAQFPGNFKDIARRAVISTANFAGFASGHNFPVGQMDANHWGASVTVLETTSAGPYHFNFHHNDLGNFTLIGRPGRARPLCWVFCWPKRASSIPESCISTRIVARKSSCAPSGAATTLSAPGRRPASILLRCPIRRPIARFFSIGASGW